MNIRKAITRNFLTGSLGRVISALTPLLLVPFMIRTWGLHQYGEWLILTAIPSYIMLSPDFGLAGAVVNQMAIATAGGKKGEAICLYRTSWLILTVMALVFVLAGIVVGLWVNWKALGVTQLSANAAGIISYSCIQIFLAQQIFLIAGIYRSARCNPRYGLLGSIGGAFCLVIAIWALALKVNPIQYVALNTVTRALFLFAMLFDVRRLMPEFTLSPKGVSIRAIRPYIIPGLGQASMPIVNALQNEGMLLLLGAVLGPISVAVFQTTRTAMNGGKSLIGLSSNAVGVEIPALVGEGKMNVVGRLLVLNTQASVVATFLWMAIMGLSGETIFHLWLHSGDVYSAPLVFIMLLSLLPFAFSNSLTLVLLATNQVHRAVALLIIAAVLSLAVTAVGAHLFGLNGAATGLIAFEAISLMVVNSIAKKHLSFDVRQIFVEAFSRHSLNSTYKSALAVLRPGRSDVC
jgi:O-antigen/teichoic acid export membrane protein